MMYMNTRPVFATKNSLLVVNEGIYGYTKINDVYFIYDYEVEPFDANMLGSIASVRTMLAQQCDMPEKYVFYSPSNDILCVTCDGRLVVNGYYSSYYVNNSSIHRYVRGHVYAGIRQVHNVSDDMDIFYYTEQSWIFALRNRYGQLFQIVLGVENDNVLRVLDEAGFALSKKVNIDNVTSLQTITGSETYPCSITRNGKENVMKSTIHAALYFRNLPDMQIYLYHRRHYSTPFRAWRVN